MAREPYPKANIPEGLFDQILQELENFAGWRWEDGQEGYANELRTLVKTLESYQSSPQMRENKMNEYGRFWVWLEERKYRFWRKVTDSEGETREFVFGLELVRQGFEEGWGNEVQGSPTKAQEVIE